MGAPPLLTPYPCVYGSWKLVALQLPPSTVDAGGCSLDKNIDDDSNYHAESFSDSDGKSHNDLMQAVDDAEVEELLSNNGNSHTCLQQVLLALDPDQPTLVATSDFDKDTMDFIPASSPKHVQLSVEEIFSA